MHVLIESVVCCLIFLSISPRASSVAPCPLLSSLGRLARSELVVKSERLSGRGDFRDYELSAYFHRQLHEFVTVGAAWLFLSSAVAAGRVHAHSEHRFPASSSKRCQNWLRHWRGTRCLSPGSCPPTRSAPSERLLIRLWKQRNAQAPA